MLNGCSTANRSKSNRTAVLENFNRLRVRNLKIWHGCRGSTLGIAVIVVAFQAVKAAVVNPAKSLREG